MSILVDSDTRVVVQGITGGEGEFHAAQMIEYGTNVVAGAVPGKGGQEVHGVPVYDTVDRAAREENADASVIFLPPVVFRENGTVTFEAVGETSALSAFHDALATAGRELLDWDAPALSNDDLLDAFALAVTGSPLTGDLRTLPDDPTEDATGLRMEMVYATPL